jgi:transposase, IS5 family
LELEATLGSGWLKLWGMTHQPSFAPAEFAAKKKVTRREKFLARMEEVIPWTQLLAIIEPFYPQGKRGRPPMGLERMLRVYFLQQWYGLADILFGLANVVIGSRTAAA